MRPCRIWLEYAEHDKTVSYISIPVLTALLSDANLIEVTTKHGELRCKQVTKLNQEIVTDLLKSYQKRSWWQRWQYSRRAATLFKDRAV